MVSEKLRYDRIRHVQPENSRDSTLMASELEVYFALTLKYLKTLTPCPQKAAPEGFILPFCREKKLAAAQSIYPPTLQISRVPGGSEQDAPAVA